MSSFDINQIANLVERLGGNQQQAKQMLAKIDGHRVDPSDPQHAKLLQQLGVDPQELQNGGYARHLEDNDPAAATIGQGALYGEDND
jgi:hypothetical protein